MQDPPRITFISSSLNFGGAENVTRMLCNHWAKKGYFITLISFDRGEESKWKLHPDIHRISILKNLSQRKSSWLLRKIVAMLRLRKEILKSKPTVVISFQDIVNIIVLIALTGCNIPVIVSERNHPAYRTIPMLYRWLRKMLYPKASEVIVQTKAIKIWFMDNISDLRISIIPNPLPAKDERCEKDCPVLITKPCIIGMGSLHPQKGFDMLISAFALINKFYPEWHLYIIGDGFLKEKLLEQADRLGIDKRFHLLGYQPDPLHILKQGDMFVLSSRFEGYPNALIEAMSVGLAVISFNCPSGPGEIITNGYNGILVEKENIEELAKTMLKVIDEPRLRNVLGNNAMRIIDTLSLEEICIKWENIIEDTIMPQTPKM